MSELIVPSQVDPHCETHIDVWQLPNDGIYYCRADFRNAYNNNNSFKGFISCRDANKIKAINRMLACVRKKGMKSVTHSPEVKRSLRG